MSDINVWYQRLITNAAKYSKEKILLTTLEVFMESQRMTAFKDKIKIT